jgi:transposase InsO family protein
VRIHYEYIREQQQQDANLLQMHQRRPKLFFYIPMEGNIEILVFVKQGDDPNTAWRIALPSSMVHLTIRWFHEILGHCGSKRLRLTLNQRYYHPEMRKFIDRYACDACQRYKLSGPGYGLLPERNVRETPWDDVAVDMIGPWNVPIGDRIVQFKALTIIDPVTNLTELVRVSNKTSAHVASKFEQTWLARYPFPKNVIHDNGGEFTGWEFQRLLEKLNIKDEPITSKNPQSNAIVERMHQTVGNILRTLVHTTPPEDVTSAKRLVDEALSTTQHALRAAVSTALGSSPGALVFGRDMFLDVPMIADWHLIARRREQMVNESLRRENMKRRRYDYVQGQRVMMKVFKPNKLEATAKGPYRIVQVHVNGTVTLELRQAGETNEAVLERVNIRRIIPYKEPMG